jgi:hypothetical protein
VQDGVAELAHVDLFAAAVTSLAALLHGVYGHELAHLDSEGVVHLLHSQILADGHQSVLPIIV